MHALMPPSHGCEPCRTRKYIQPLFSRACAPARTRPPAAPAAAAGLRVLCMRACSWRGTSASVALLGGRQADSKQRRLILHVRSTLSPILYIRRATWPRQHCYIFYYCPYTGAFADRANLFGASQMKKFEKLYEDKKWSSIAAMHDEALSLARQLQQWPSAAMLMYNMLSTAACYVCRYELSMEINDELRAFARKAGDRRALMQASFASGKVHIQLGQLQKALLLFTEAHTIALEFPGCRVEEGRSLGYMGLCHQRMGKCDLALKAHDKHLEIALALGNEEMEAMALADAAVCHSSNGNFDRAITLLNRAVGGGEAVKRPDLKYQWMCDMGKTLLAQVERECKDVPEGAYPRAELKGKLQDARVLLREAIASCEGGRKCREDCLLHLACVEWLRTNTSQAIEYFQEYLGSVVRRGRQTCGYCGQARCDEGGMLTCGGCSVMRYCTKIHQKIAWVGAGVGFDLNRKHHHRDMCALLKKWRHVTKGRLTAEARILKSALSSDCR